MIRFTPSVPLLVAYLNFLLKSQSLPFDEDVLPNDFSSSEYERLRLWAGTPKNDDRNAEVYALATEIRRRIEGPGRAEALTELLDRNDEFDSAMRVGVEYMVLSGKDGNEVVVNDTIHKEVERYKLARCTVTVLKATPERIYQADQMIRNSIDIDYSKHPCVSKCISPFGLPEQKLKELFDGYIVRDEESSIYLSMKITKNTATGSEEVCSGLLSLAKKGYNGGVTLMTPSACDQYFMSTWARRLANRARRIDTDSVVVNNKGMKREIPVKRLDSLKIRKG